MDVRQFAFLADQPSAAVKNRESFLGMPKRGLAFLLANVMFWQPMWAQADGINAKEKLRALAKVDNAECQSLRLVCWRKGDSALRVVYFTGKDILHLE
ncbi:hypothetical protein ACXR0M_07325 [Pseudomonas sp. Eth.TT006]